MAAELKRVTWSLDEAGGFNPNQVSAAPTDSLMRPQKRKRDVGGGRMNAILYLPV